jgi:hypothetical protein
MIVLYAYKGTHTMFYTSSFPLQAENGKDIPEDCEDLAAAKEVLAAVEETFKA